MSYIKTNKPLTAYLPIYIYIHTHCIQCQANVWFTRQLLTEQAISQLYLEARSTNIQVENTTVGFGFVLFLTVLCSTSLSLNVNAHHCSFFHIVVPRLSQANIILTLLMLQTNIAVQCQGNICNTKDVEWGLCDKYTEERRGSQMA